MAVVLLIGALAGAAAAAGGYGVATQDEAEGQQADVGGRTIDAHQIYQQIMGGPGGRSLVDGQQAASTLQSRYAERAGRIAELNRQMAANWTGEGGAGAARGAEPLKVWMADSATNLGHANTALDDQYGAFTTVSGKVRPVPGKPPESHFLNDLAPWETDLDEEIKRYNEDARTNVDAFNVYYQSSTTNAQQMPAYSTMQGQYGNIDVDTGPGSGDGSGSGDGYGGSPPSSYAPSGMGGAGGGNYSAAGVPASNVGAGGASYGPDGGYGGSYGSPGYGDSHDNPPGYGTLEWGGGTGTGTAGYIPPSSNVPGFGSNTGFGPGTGGHGSGSYGTGNYGAGGSYGGGYGAAGGAYGGGGYSGYGPRGSGAPSAGAASGTAAPGSSSATGGYPGSRAGSTAGSATGRPMMGPMGGGRGQGGEDEEHERKYLIEEDANELFGTDQKTPPPVIGE